MVCRPERRAKLLTFCVGESLQRVRRQTQARIHHACTGVFDVRDRVRDFMGDDMTEHETR